MLEESLYEKEPETGPSGMSRGGSRVRRRSRGIGRGLGGRQAQHPERSSRGKEARGDSMGNRIGMWKQNNM